MAVLGFHGWFEGMNWPGFAAIALSVVAAVALVIWRRFRHPFLATAFVLSASVAAGWPILSWWRGPGGLLHEAARVCAVLAMLWILAAAGVTIAAAAARRGDPVKRPIARPSGFVRAAHFAALLLGVVTAIIQSVVLVMRAVFVATDLINTHPDDAMELYGFQPAGLWSLGFLLAACVVASFTTRDRRVVTCAFCVAALTASWACLLAPAVRRTPVGGYERTGVTLLWLSVLSLLLLAAVIIARVVDRRGCGRDREGGDSEPRPWPGLASFATVIVWGIVLLVCYHLAVPNAATPGGFRAAAAVTTASAALGAAAGFLVIGRWWRTAVADGAMVLASLALCGLPTLVLSSTPEALAERYPLVFNAMMVGLAVAAAWWTGFACEGERRRKTGRAWTAADRLIPYARRFSFFSAALGLMIGAMMALWPRWPTVPATDDSLGRVTAGVAANLWLLLVMLWCSRRLHKMTFQVLAVLAVVSLTGFLLARMLPFTPRFG